MAITGGVLLKPLCAALGIDEDSVRRIVIDVDIDSIVIVYVEMVGSQDLIAIDWPGYLGDADVTIASGQ